MLCSNCGTDLPDNSKFCLQCGRTTIPLAQDPPTTTAVCKKCGTELPPGARFCLRCGRPVPGTIRKPDPPNVSFCDCGTKLPPKAYFCPMCGKGMNVGPNHPISLQLRNPSRSFRYALWLLLPVLLAVGAWSLLVSNSDSAQRLQRMLTGSHAESIAPPVFSIKARGFSSYKFSVPTGAVSATVSGEFTATGDASSDIEVYIFKEDAFVNWQSGFTPSSFYSSGRVRQADIQASLPTGGGTYYLVFNNNFSTRTTKSVQADVTLHHSNFWPAF